MPTPIQERYAELRSALDLGEVRGGEEGLYDGGALQEYDSGGRIYYHPRVGTPFATYGPILERYLELGGERSQLGYPTSDVTDDPALAGGRLNTFEWGVIRWNEADGVSVELDVTEPQWVTHVVVKLADSISVPIGAGSSWPSLSSRHSSGL